MNDQHHMVASCLARDFTGLGLVAILPPGPYRVMQEIPVGVCIWNRGSNEEWIDRRMVYQAHVFIRLYNKNGDEVAHPDGNYKAHLARAQRDDFIKLAPNKWYGRWNLTGGRLRSPISGILIARLDYQHFAEYRAMELGIPLNPVAHATLDLDIISDKV